MKTRQRHTSLITGCDTETLFVLKNFPVYMMADDKDDAFCDMSFEIGKDDGFVQLATIIPAEILYKDTHSNAVGGVWKGAHELVAEKVKEYSGTDSKILEIGGATGKLNVIYQGLGGKSKHWDIIEAQPCPVPGCTARYIKGIFPDALEGNDQYDMILHTHCMEHMEDLHAFMEGVLNHLAPKGRMVFSVPDMQQLLENGMTSIVNFEHTMLLTERYIDYLLGMYGFSIEEKRRYGNGHSLIYVTCHTEIEKVVDFAGMYDNNKELMKSFYMRHQKQMCEWNEKLRNDDRNCYLFGAHITAQFFACFGLNMSRICGLLDNDTKKIGKRVSGIDQEIFAPSILKDQKNAIVILPKSPYSVEIKDTILENINSEVDFWTMV